MIRSFLRGGVAIVVALAVHAFVIAALLDAREPVVLVQGSRIEVKFGGDRPESAAALADQGQATTEPQPVTPETEQPTEPEPQQEPITEPEPIPQPDEPVIVPEEPVRPIEEPEPEPEENVQPPEEVAEPPVTQQPEEPQETEPTEQEAPPAEDAGTTEDTNSEDGEQTADSAASLTEGSASGDKDAETTNLQAGNSEADSYAGEIVKILSRRRLPSSLRSGSAKVTFTLNTDGEIEEIEIRETSGSKRFDREAIKLVEKAAPFPEPPPGIELTFTVVIEQE
ncbi:MAG: TonB family protein [Pseudomonadota bacterium]